MFIPSIPLLSFLASIHYLYISLLVLDCYLSRMFFFSCCFSTEILSLCPSLIPSCFLHLFLHFFIFTLYVNVTLLLIHIFPPCQFHISFFPFCHLDLDDVMFTGGAAASDVRRSFPASRLSQSQLLSQLRS